ncbi:MAG TPA: bifunctional homocysteine S-methyltransferase/methylenetetrahydrofolate reductase [Vicinamibacterales bacterium]|nr:bifunctional homocysteine S-methyltransferase/methylenetetrahydrofolate reductase [Vicinamibacterales bacterium]
MPSVHDALAERVLVCDGAMGTMLYSRGIFINRSFDALNLTQPDLVAGVHAEYVQAGADVIETNTFGANPVKLATFGLADQLRAINAAGVRLARQAARGRAFVAGAIGPLGIRIEPWGKTGVDEAEALFREQIEALLEEGVDLFILETFRDLNEIGAALAAVRSLCDLPVVAQMTTEEDGNSLDGTPPEKFAPELARRGATVVGVNCSVGPAPMLETIERIERTIDLPLSAQPNAGRPRDIEGRTIYLASPEYMASYARRFIALGVRLVGGCCGTTPEHIRLIKQAVEGQQRGRVQTTVAAATAGRTAAFEGRSVEAPAAAGAPPVPREEKSRMAHALARGKFVIAVELLPPTGYDPTPALEYARVLKIRGVDVVTIPDGPRGSARMSAMALSVLVQQQAGIEPVLQYACRDRHLVGMQSDLLGAHAVGIRNLLLFTGDPRKVGDYSDATVVIEVDSIGLTNAVSRLNRGCDVGGQAIGPPTAFHTGVIANPAAPDLDDEVRRFEYKVDAGAEFAVTPPIYDPERLQRFLDLTAHVRIPIIAAVRPFDSLRHAEYLANEVPNVHVPPAIVDRMRKAGTAQAQVDEGIAIAREVARELRPRVQGLQVGGPQAAVLAVIDGL